MDGHADRIRGGEGLRKVVHAASAVWAIWVLRVDDPRATLMMCAMTGLVIGADAARLGLKDGAAWVYKALPYVFRRDERSRLSGASHLMVGMTVTSALFPPIPAAAGLLCLAWGDAAAAVVGRWAGPVSPRAAGEPDMAARDRKTPAGSLSCFVVSAISVGWLTDWNPLTSLAAGLTSAVMERWTPGRWDNLTIPIATAAVVALTLARA